MLNIDEIFERTKEIPSWTSEEERKLLVELAAAVPAGGRIVEIGSLYGGTTAVLALANPEAKITAVDNFSWHPIAGRTASKEALEEVLKTIGAGNVKVMAGDSREIGPGWSKPIDFLWIDGGHSYEYVFADLTNFGHHTQVIALHDYGNPAWESIRKAVEDYIFVNPHWAVDRVVGMAAVLRRVQPA